MPTYRYRCGFCLEERDEYRRIDDRDDFPQCHNRHMHRIITPAAVKVFNGYQTAAFDKETGERMRITNSSEHEAFLRRNGYEEVGNDKSMAPRHEEQIAEDHARQRKEAQQDAGSTVSPDEALRKGLVSEDISI